MNGTTYTRSHGYYVWEVTRGSWVITVHAPKHFSPDALRYVARYTSLEAAVAAAAVTPLD